MQLEATLAMITHLAVVMNYPASHRGRLQPEEGVCTHTYNAGMLNVLRFVD
jgi:hypothetical protein